MGDGIQGYFTNKLIKYTKSKSLTQFVCFRDANISVFTIRDISGNLFDTILVFCSLNKYQKDIRSYDFVSERNPPT